jgi:hypothetical protein
MNHSRIPKPGSIGCSILLFLLAILALHAASSAQPAAAAGSLSLTITLGEKNCQVAVWIADARGNFIHTIYVSRKTGRKGLGNRGGGLDDKFGGSRLSLLPVWAYARGVDYGGGNFYPPKSKPLPDAVSSATPPAGRFDLVWTPATPLPAGEYHFFIEVNKSFDDNAHHHYSWYRGQPSVVWRGVLTVGDIASTGRAEIIGHGDPAGADGKITADVSTLTSALDLITSITAVYQP